MDPKNPPQCLDDLPLKRKALAILTDNGLTTAEAGKALEYKGKSVYDSKTRLNKHNLSNRKLGSLAFKAVKETLKMKPLKTNEFKICPACKNDMEKVLSCPICKGNGILRTEIFPSHGNRLEASKMYYDRADPAVSINHNLNVNVDISPVDMSKYRNKD